jgi:hypothetical protein
MSERPTDFQLARQLLQSVGGYAEVAHRSRGIITVAARIVPDPGDQPLEELEGRSLVPDSSVRTRLVFNDEGALVPEECSVNRKVPHSS